MFCPLSLVIVMEYAETVKSKNERQSLFTSRIFACTFSEISSQTDFVSFIEVFESSLHHKICQINYSLDILKRPRASRH